MMTDSNATELLRKLLDERGVKPRKAFTRVLKGYINPVNHYTHWDSPIGICSYHENESADGDSLCFLEVCGTKITPEQAIAATLGNAERTCERVTHGLERDREIATVSWTCSECGAHMGRDYNYCPNCGARVVGE